MSLFRQLTRISFEVKNLKTGYFLLPTNWGGGGGGGVLGVLARKHDHSGTFSYYFLLILSFIKSDDGGSWYEYAMGRNLLKFQKNLDGFIFNSIV